MRERGPMRTRKLKILFLCGGNSCRSQMAEGLARHLTGDVIEPFSAGVASQVLDPRAVKVMEEIGIDISRQRSKAIDEVAHLDFDCVVTVCDSARESCPFFPGAARLMHRDFEDPPLLAAGARSEEQALAHYRRIRDEIKAFVEGLPGILTEERPGQEAAGGGSFRGDARGQTQGRNV
jgi:arsenate reductase